MKINTLPPRLLALGIALGCAASMAAPLAEAEKPVESTLAPAGLRLTAVKLASVGTWLAAADSGGSGEAGPGCVAGAPDASGELIRQRVEADLPQAFQRELVNARIGSPRYEAMSSGLMVSAFVNDLKARVCNVGAGAWRGRFYVQVSWHVAQRQSGETLYQASTTGFFDHKEASASTSAASGLSEAFAMSIRNLLTDQRLAAVLQPTESEEETLASAVPY